MAWYQPTRPTGRSMHAGIASGLKARERTPVRSMRPIPTTQAPAAMGKPRTSRLSLPRRRSRTKLWSVRLASIIKTPLALVGGRKIVGSVGK